jgi:16S rRNA (guanine527-N7)-methyltransferase
MKSEPQRLIEDARVIGVTLEEPQAERLLQLLDELSRWNRSYNLTAITTREAAISAHLLDSLSALPELTGSLIADVGTGAGFPGLPLALLEPQRQFTLIGFVTHAARTLELANITPLQIRVETFAPPTPFDTVLARAFAALPDLLKQIQGLCGPHTHVVALKGRYPQDELAEIPRGWRLAQVRALEIPHLAGERHILTFQPQPV